MVAPIYEYTAYSADDHLNDLLVTLGLEQNLPNYRLLLRAQQRYGAEQTFLDDIVNAMSSENSEASMERLRAILSSLQWDETNVLDDLCQQLVRDNSARESIDIEGGEQTFDYLPAPIQNHFLFAAQYGDTELLEQLISIVRSDQRQADSTARFLAYLLTVAAHYGQTTILDTLIAQNVPKETNITHFAAAQGHLNVLEWAKSHGVALDATNSDGGNIVHIAAREGDIDILEWAKSNGVPLDKKDSEGGTPLETAIFYGKDIFVRALLNDNPNYGATRSLACNAAQEGHSAIITTLSEYAIDLNTLSDQGFSPCFIAAQFNQIDALIALIMHQANHTQNCTPQPKDKLMSVFNNDYPNFVEPALAFINRQQDQNNIIMSPTDIAKILGHENIVLLLENKEAIKALRGYNLLIDSVTQLELHAKNLLCQKDQKSQAAGKEAQILATQLKNTANNFINEIIKTPADRGKIEKLQERFKTQLDEGYKNLGKHRAAWKPVLLNIAIAATGIGLLLVIAKTLYSGHAFFAETKRQRQVKDIINAAESVIPHKIS